MTLRIPSWGRISAVFVGVFGLTTLAAAAMGLYLFKEPEQVSSSWLYGFIACCALLGSVLNERRRATRSAAQAAFLARHEQEQEQERTDT